MQKTIKPNNQPLNFGAFVSENNEFFVKWTISTQYEVLWKIFKNHLEGNFFAFLRNKMLVKTKHFSIDGAPLLFQSSARNFKVLVAHFLNNFEFESDKFSNTGKHSCINTTSFSRV